MNSKDRALCVEFLLKVANRSNADAKRLVRSSDPVKLALLLENARDWKLMGRPVRAADGSLVAIDPPEQFDAPPLLNDVVGQPKTAASIEPQSPARSPKQKKVMYSVLLPPSDLEALRVLSEQTGEPSAFHVRTAIRRYLKDFEKGAV